MLRYKDYKIPRRQEDSSLDRAVLSIVFSVVIALLFGFIYLL